MAKAKKSEVSGVGKAPATGAKKAPKTKAVASPAMQPMIDTNLVAESAAKRLVAGLSATGSTANASKPESASFKHLKDSLSKPTASGIAGMLDKTAGPGNKQSNTPFHGGKQLGRNQTFGADVNRSGVPRRTGGG